MDTLLLNIIHTYVQKNSSAGPAPCNASKCMSGDLCAGLSNRFFESQHTTLFQTTRAEDGRAALFGREPVQFLKMHVIALTETDTKVWNFG